MGFSQFVAIGFDGSTLDRDENENKVRLMRL
jgi:hypothetical protein